MECMSLSILSNVYCEEVDNLDVAVADSNPLSMDGKLLPSTPAVEVEAASCH